MPDPTPARRKYVTQQQAAAFVGCHPKTIRRWVERGLISGFKLPGSRHIRVDLNEVESMLRTIPATTVRAGSTNFGPRSRIYSVTSQPEIVDVEGGGDR